MNAVIKPVSIETLKDVLNTRFGGVLKEGVHKENSECCALELLSVCRKIKWTDSPAAVGSWDLRKLNDISVSDSVRTKHMLPVLAAYSDSRSWPRAKAEKILKSIVILTVQRIVSSLPCLPPEKSEMCRNAKTLKEARAAANAATYAADAATYAADAATYAADAATYAADAATYVAGAAADAYATAQERIFITACEIWMEAFNSYKEEN